MKKHFSLPVVFVVLAVGMCLSQSTTVSLAELAHEGHKDKKPVKVFTEADLPAHPSSDADQNSASSAGSASSSNDHSNTADGKPADKPLKSVDGKEKAAAPGKASPASELKKELDHYTAQRDAWKQSIKRYEDLLATDQDPFRRKTYEDALSVDRNNVDLYQAKIEELQNDLTKTEKHPATNSAPAAQSDSPAEVHSD
jgi:hypothetical protein